MRMFTTALLVSLLCAALPASSALAQGQPPRQKDMAIDQPQARQVVDQLIVELNRMYVFPEGAKKIEVALRQRVKRGEYANIVSAEKLAAELTAQMRKETGDLHLGVQYSEEEIPLQQTGAKPSPQQMAKFIEELRVRNFGVDRVERLPFNIGYLKLAMFASGKGAGDTLGAAMTMMSNLDSLIIDLRQNGGGSPETVALLASYFFDERTRLNDIYFREGNRTEQGWTTTFVSGSRFGQTKPVYILTSKQTFSAAEDFSYAMKNLKRATIVGETTGGGAHPGDMVRLNAHFGVFVPNGRSISSITQTDWEGVGVVPDVAVKADDAFKTAQVALLRQLAGAETNPQKLQRIEARIGAVEADGKL